MRASAAAPGFGLAALARLVEHVARIAGFAFFAPRDPFFDKPYEPGQADATPAWEAAAKAAPSRGISSNIKTKRKVAALFKSAETS